MTPGPDTALTIRSTLSGLLIGSFREDRIDPARGAGYALARDGAAPSAIRPDRGRHLVKGDSCDIALR